MKDMVKQLCKAKGITLKDLADKIGIARESLTRALDGNPTLSTIQGIADGLNIEVSQLFIGSENALNGFVDYQGTIHRIQSKDDLEKLLALVK